MNKLEQAARALLAHWDTPAWKYLKPTGDLIADLREALAEQAEQESVGDGICLTATRHPHNCCVLVDDVSEDSIEQVEQAEQEPVAWMDLTREELHQIEMTCETSAECYRVIAKALKDRNYAAPQPVQQEPVCIDWDTKTDEPIIGYDAPVRTKDLTDDEIVEIMKQPFNQREYMEQFARAVIAADREKNK